MPFIEVDQREHADTLVNELLERYNVEIEYRQLKLGDYRIPPGTVVERKTADDFCRSIIDGRLFSQAYRLAEYADNPILILEGDHEDVTVGVADAAVEGALVSLAQSFRLPVLRTAGQVESARVLHRLATQRARAGSNSGVLRGGKGKRLRTRKVRFLRGLPAVGPKLAGALLKHFGTVRAMLSASAGELAQVAGIGVDRARDIVEFLDHGD
jgi:ERCC4-type nuclease